jgi:predicted nucleic acid-binding protein
VEQTIMTILLDSVILIDHFNGIAQATAYLGQVRDEASISVITRAEVLTGFDSSDRQQPAALLDCYPLYDITKPIADLAADLRREQGWKLPDAFQAALARHHQLRLATRNTKDFPPERYEFVIVPYEL